MNSRKFQFGIPTLLWTATLFAIVCAWYMSAKNQRTRYEQKIQSQQAELNETVEGFTTLLSDVHGRKFQLENELGLITNIQDATKTQIKNVFIPRQVGGLLATDWPLIWRWRVYAPKLSEFQVGFGFGSLQDGFPAHRPEFLKQLSFKELNGIHGSVNHTIHADEKDFLADNEPANFLMVLLIEKLADVEPTQDDPDPVSAIAKLVFEFQQTDSMAQKRYHTVNWQLKNSEIDWLLESRVRQVSYGNPTFSPMQEFELPMSHHGLDLEKGRYELVRMNEKQLSKLAGNLGEESNASAPPRGFVLWIQKPE